MNGKDFLNSSRTVLEQTNLFNSPHFIPPSILTLLSSLKMKMKNDPHFKSVFTLEETEQSSDRTRERTKLLVDLNLNLSLSHYSLFSVPLITYLHTQNSSGSSSSQIQILFLPLFCCYSQLQNSLRIIIVFMSHVIHYLRKQNVRRFLYFSIFFPPSELFSLSNSQNCSLSNSRLLTHNNHMYVMLDISLHQRGVP